MSRPAQIRFLSRFAPAYDPVVQFMGFRPLWRAMAEIASPQIGERGLDVCTGTGGVALELARRGARIVGVDLARGMLQRARRKHDNTRSASAQFLPMDARQLAFGNRSFSLVTASMALHEMAETEREQALREIARVASDRVVIADYRVPHDAPRRFLFRATRWFEHLESDDFGAFVTCAVGDRLERVGLRITESVDVGPYRIWRCEVPR
ncbi:MAG TPA: class I SAM-dependent methyltransferase [Candidatus Binatia bacterium]|nr:class I SAM-dependent methyltransferase [Candidatus Binatia bacterium]